MSGVRKPVLLGLTRRAGTSTLAAALHATDGGRLAMGAAGAADVLVATADPTALRRASGLVLAPDAAPPVLVLTGTADPSTGFGLGGRFGALVALPYVRRWTGVDARAEAAAALAVAPDRLPPDVRAYAHTVLHLVSVLIGSGRLQRAVPPVVSRAAGPTLWRGLAGSPGRPIDGQGPTAGRRPAEPDDEALEADAQPLSVVLQPAGRARNAREGPGRLAGALTGFPN